MRMGVPRLCSVPEAKGQADAKDDGQRVCEGRQQQREEESSVRSSQMEYDSRLRNEDRSVQTTESQTKRRASSAASHSAPNGADRPRAVGARVWLAQTEARLSERQPPVPAFASPEWRILQKVQGHGDADDPGNLSAVATLSLKMPHRFRKKKKTEHTNKRRGSFGPCLRCTVHSASVCTEPTTDRVRSERPPGVSIASWKLGPGERSPQGKTAEHATSLVTTLRKPSTTHCRTSTGEGKNPKHGRQHVVSEFNGFSELTQFSIPDVYFAELCSNCATKPPTEVSFSNATARGLRCGQN